MFFLPSFPKFTEGDQQLHHGWVPEGSGADLKQPVNAHLQGDAEEGVHKFYKTLIYALNACVTHL